MKKNDLLLIIFVLLVSAAAYFGFKLISKGEEGTEVLITVDGGEFGRFMLGQDKIIEIPGTCGINILEIKDGYVDMLSAECPDKICVNHKKIHYNKETIVCLPGRIIVEIIGGEESGLDGVVN